MRKHFYSLYNLKNVAPTAQFATIFLLPKTPPAVESRKRTHIDINLPFSPPSRQMILFQCNKLQNVVPTALNSI